MKKVIYKWIFSRLLGWKLIGTIDENTSKCILMIVPHTSWLDLYLGIFFRGIIDIEINWVGKKELFRFPLGWYFKYMGGEPIDRKGGLNKVEAIAELFEKKEVFRLAITPEGTRKKVTELKTGFYYIAIKANIPIIPVAFDYGKKEVRFGKLFFPTENLEEDLKILCGHFINTQGKHPKNSFDI